jgi:hypothetical protein
VSAVVAASSLCLGVVLIAGLSTYPAVAFNHVPRPVWGSAFLAVGLVHAVLLAAWHRGHSTPGLAAVHLATCVLAAIYTTFSWITVVWTHEGYQLACLLTGGAILANLCARVGLWRFETSE